MPIDRLRWLALAAPLLISACAYDSATMGGVASAFGDANRQTMLVQIVDPDPHYEFLDPPTSGEHAAQAIERYRTDKVKQPDRTSTTETIGNSGSGR